MPYQLKFIDSFEAVVRAINIQADDDEAAINYSCAQSIYFDTAVELWCAEDLIARLTPMTARLYLPDLVVPHFGAPRQSPGSRVLSPLVFPAPEASPLVTTEQFEALCALEERRKGFTLPQYLVEPLVAGRYIEFTLGSWIVTSRGHAAILLGKNDPAPDAA